MCLAPGIRSLLQLQLRYNFLFLHSEDTTLVAKKYTKRWWAPNIFWNLFSARVLNVLAVVRLDFFHAMGLRGSEHIEEKVYEVYTQSVLSWSTVSIGNRSCQL